MRIELLRTHERSPDGRGKFYFRFAAENQADLAQVENVVLRGELPPGFHLKANWLDTWSFTLAVEADEAPTAVADAPPKKKGDGLDQMEDKDLKTLMAEKGLSYDAKKFNRFAGIQALREKLKDVAAVPQPVGAGV